MHYHLKDYKKAYEFHLQYSELQEDIFSINQFDKLNEMEAKFQFQNQQEQIEIIIDNNKKLKEINQDLEAEKTKPNYFIYALIVLSLILLVVCIRLYKRK